MPLNILANFCKNIILIHGMNLINILLTVLGSCILEPVPENKSRVTGTRVRSGSLSFKRILVFRHHSALVLSARL